MANVSFAPVLNVHQPAWNLEDLLQHREWEAKEILWAIDRIPRSLWSYEDVGRVHLALSGTLLETLSSPEFQHRVYGMVDPCSHAPKRLVTRCSKASKRSVKAAKLTFISQVSLPCSDVTPSAIVFDG